MPSAIRRDTLLRLARRTLSCPTAPYHEGAVIAWLRAFAAERPHLVLREDPDGNLELGRRGVRRGRSPLVLAAHMDHPGFRARRSVASGASHRVEAWFLGRVALAAFPGARVRFFAGERSIAARVERVRGRRRGPYPSVELCAAGPVPRGAFGTWDFPGFRRGRRDPDRIDTRAADDLAGVAAILAVFDAVERSEPRRRVDVRGLFTRGEEAGFAGALAVARGRRLPRGARLVSVEASKALPQAPLGGGPIVRVGDATSVFDDALTRWIAGVASRLAGPRGARFAWQRRLMDGGVCESTAYQAYGYRSAAVCLPLGNYHNMDARGRIAAEWIRLSDLVGLARLLEGLVREGAAAPRGAAADPLLRRFEGLRARGRRELARDPGAPVG